MAFPVFSYSSSSLNTDITYTINSRRYIIIVLTQIVAIFMYYNEVIPTNQCHI